MNVQHAIVCCPHCTELPTWCSACGGTAREWIGDVCTGEWCKTCEGAAYCVHCHVEDLDEQSFDCAACCGTGEGYGRSCSSCRGTGVDRDAVRAARDEARYA